MRTTSAKLGVVLVWACLATPVGGCEDGDEVEAPRETSREAMPAHHAQSATISQPAPLLERSREARRLLDIAALGTIADELARAQQSADATGANEVRLELADVAATQALELAIRSSLVTDETQQLAKALQDALQRADETLDRIEVERVDERRVKRVIAKVELARGSDVAATHPLVLLPSAHDPELRLAVLAAPLWRDAKAQPSDALIDELASEAHGNVLPRVLLSLALFRRGDHVAAGERTEGILALAPGQPTAMALAARLESDDSGKPDPGMASPDPAGNPDLDPGSPPPHAAPGSPAENPGNPDPGSPPPHAAPGGVPASDPSVVNVGTPSATTTVREAKPKSEKPTLPKPERTPRSADELTSEGCELATRDPERALSTLQKAHDLKPGDTKIVLCMAEAHAKAGRDASAQALCERVLRGSPNNKKALLLLAKLEDRRGNTSAARGLYERVLAIDPDNAVAKNYVTAHAG